MGSSTATGRSNSTSISSSSTSWKRYKFSYLHILAAFLLGCCVSTIFLTFIHVNHLHLSHETVSGGSGDAGSGGIMVTANIGSSSSSSGQDRPNQQQQQQPPPPQQQKVMSVHHVVSTTGKTTTTTDTTDVQQQQKQHHNDNEDDHHPVAGLDCTAHGGGPTDSTSIQEMVYWRDIPQDSSSVLEGSSSSSTSWRSPFNRRIQVSSSSSQTQPKQPKQRQYLTFEPDGGGFNNIRMSLETVITMAVAMGRILVLPPAQKMYLLGHTDLSFGDFFPLRGVAKEHLDGVGFEIITTEQFLQEISSSTADTEFQTLLADHPIPQNGRTNWDGDTNAAKQILSPYLRKIATSPGDDWDPRSCIAAFPQSTSQSDIDELQTTMTELLHELNPSDGSNDGGGDNTKKLQNILSKLPESYINHPTPVNATTKERLREFLAGRNKLCIYDQRLQSASIIHFHGKAVNAKHQSAEKQKELAGGGGRLLVHFYAFLFFQDYRADLWMKRFARDHIRYKDDIQCAAARVVEAVRIAARQYDSTNTNGSFDAFHIRRGDFQYKAVKIEASKIVEMAQSEIPTGRTVYVGTDERNKSFFQPLRDHGWNVLFLDDFMHLISDIDSHHYGMIDQLVTSRSHVFFGCWFSTFTGYIVRLRGYHSQRTDIASSNLMDPSVAKEHEQGKLPMSYYYALKEHKMKLHDYWPIKQAFYAREFPTSWWNLDWDV